MPKSLVFDYRLTLILVAGLALPAGIRASEQDPRAASSRTQVESVGSQGLQNLEVLEKHAREELEKNPHSATALYRLGQVAAAQRRFQNAAHYFRQAVALEPGNLDYDMSLALASLQSNAVAEGISILERLKLKYPGWFAVHLNLALAYTEQQRDSEAAEAYAAALRLEPKNQTLRLALGKALVATKRFETALPHSEEYSRANPGDFEGHYLNGTVLRALQFYERAEVELSRAVALNADHYGAAYGLGFVLVRLGKLEEARWQLESAKRLKPESEEASYQLALVLRSLKDVTRSQAELYDFELKKLASRNQTAAGPLRSEANTLFEQGKVQEAAQLFRRALRFDPGNAIMHYNLALALNRLGDRAGERKSLEQSIRLDSRFVPAHSHLGLLHLSEGRLAEAEEAFLRALEMSPESVETLINLGTLYGSQGRNEEAESLFRRAVELAPTHPQAVLNLGLTLAALERFPEAQQIILAALNLQPSHPAILTALGMIEARLGQSRDAAAHLTQALQACGQCPSRRAIHKTLGLIYMSSGQVDKGKEQLYLALRIHPDDPEVLSALRKAGSSNRVAPSNHD